MERSNKNAEVVATMKRAKARRWPKPWHVRSKHAEDPTFQTHIGQNVLGWRARLAALVLKLKRQISGPPSRLRKK